MKGLLYSSQYQNLHIDRLMKNSMFTLKCNITSNLIEGARLLKTYHHNLGYIPQYWLFWDVNWGSIPGASRFRRSVGTALAGSAISWVELYGVADENDLRIYIKMVRQNIGGYTNPLQPTKGLSFTLTGYIFSNDTVSQDYT